MSHEALLHIQHGKMPRKEMLAEARSALTHEQPPPREHCGRSPARGPVRFWLRLQEDPPCSNRVPPRRQQSRSVPEETVAARAPGSGTVQAQRGGARLPPPGHCRPPLRALCNRWGQLDAAPCSHVPVATGLGADPGPVQWGLGGLRQGPSVGRAGSGCGTGDRGGTWWHPRSGGDSCWCN